MKGKILLAELPARSSLPERVTAIQRILEQTDLKRLIQPRDKVAIKTHFGDVDNDTHIPPELIRPVADLVKKIGGLPFLTETSTLYSGPRQNSITHIELAYEHGFTFERTGVPIIMADGLLGNTELDVTIPGQLYRKVNIARDVVLTDALILLSHPTGHMVTGLGACLKNLGMGLSSRKGKMLQHSSIKPEINRGKCTFCGQCLIWCPEKAIIEQEGKAFIISDRCIGCGECLAVCKFNAVKYNFQVQSADIQQRMAEYALGAISNKRHKSLFINVLTDMTAECDCMKMKQTPLIEDIGILAGTDPVAIDQATLDLTRERNRQDLGRLAHSSLDPGLQLAHAEKIGLGQRNYELIKT